MPDSLNILPVCQLTMSRQYDEDWQIAFQVTDTDDGSPIDLSDLDFTAYLSVQGIKIASLVGLVAGKDSNIVILFGRAIDMIGIPEYTYNLTLVAKAKDGYFNRDILGYSMLTIGAPAQVAFSVLRNDEQGLATMIVIPPAGLVHASVQVSGTFAVTTLNQVLPAALLGSGVSIKADRNNEGRIRINVGAPATGSSYWLDSGDSVQFAVRDLSQINLLGSVAGDAIAYLGQ